jgi:hypothetical protein
MFSRIRKSYSPHVLQSADVVLLAMCGDVRVDGAVSARRDTCPRQVRPHFHILTSRGRQDLLELNGLWLDRRRGAAYFPLPSVPLARLDPAHVRYLVALAVKDQ